MKRRFSLFLLGFFLGLSSGTVNGQEEVKEAIQISEVERLRIREKILESQIAITQANMLIDQLFLSRKISKEDYQFDANTWTLIPTQK